MTPGQFAVTRFYFCNYLVMAVAVTYLPVWLAGRGLDSGQIGLVNSLPMMAVMVLSVSAGRIADRAPDWTHVIRLGKTVTAAACLVLGLAGSFWAVLVIWCLVMMPMVLVSPVADGAAVRYARREGFSFGTVRAWGTTGFLLACFLTGWVTGFAGNTGFLLLLALAGVAGAGTAWRLPRLRGETAAPVPIAGAAGAGLLLSRDLRTALKPWVLLPMAGAALLFSTHIIMNAFSALVWSGQGLSQGAIGFLIGLGAAAEAAVMFLWGRISAGRSARMLILVAALTAVLRWSGMTLAPGFWPLVGLQLLQGLTFSFGYLGVINFIANRTPEDFTAEAQSVYALMSQGATVAAVTGFGFLMQRFGDGAFWASAAACAVTALAVLISFRMQGSEPAPAEEANP